MGPEILLFVLGVVLAFVALPLLGTAARRGWRGANAARAMLAPAWIGVCWLLLAPPTDVLLIGIALSVPLAILSYRVGDGSSGPDRAVP